MLEWTGTILQESIGKCQHHPKLLPDPSFQCWSKSMGTWTSPPNAGVGKDNFQEPLGKCQHHPRLLPNPFIQCWSRSMSTWTSPPNAGVDKGNKEMPTSSKVFAQALLSMLEQIYGHLDISSQCWKGKDNFTGPNREKQTLSKAFAQSLLAMLEQIYGHFDISSQCWSGQGQ